MIRRIVLAVLLSTALHAPVIAQPDKYVRLPPGTKCVVVNTTNSGTINLTCNMAREHENGIKQKGYEVGQAVGFRIGSTPNIVLFDSIVASADFDQNADFQFHGMTIGDCKAAVIGSQGSFGQTTQRGLGMVTCSRKSAQH